MQGDHNTSLKGLEQIIITIFFNEALSRGTQANNLPYHNQKIIKKKRVKTSQVPQKKQFSV